MTARQLICCCMFMLALPPALAQTSVESLNMDAPRTYGYAVGDVIRRHADIEVAKNCKIDISALPKPGPLNRWLTLRQISWTYALDTGGDHYRLELEYQIFYAPVSVKQLTIPAMEIKFCGNMRTMLPAWNFSVSPLWDYGATKEHGLPELRPDSIPSVEPKLADRLMLWFGILIAFVTSAYLVYVHIWLGYRVRGKPFADACQALFYIKEGGLSVAKTHAAFTCVHLAFNISNQAPLFVDGLEAFFIRRPQLAPLRQDVEDFFQASYGLFFGGDPHAGAAFPVERMIKLCRACLDIERKLR